MNHFRRLPASALAAALLLGACSTTPPPPLPAAQAGPDTMFGQPTATPAISNESAPALYARDGTVVVDSQAARAAAGERQSPARRDLSPGEGGRMYLLELYQNVIEERDGLSREMTSLQADLGKARVEHENAVDAQSVLREQLTALEATNAALLAENLDLAGRLTTAQIRRLQAEKLLLEHRISAERVAREAAAEAAEAAVTEVAEVSKP